MLCKRVRCTGGERAHPVTKDGEANDFKRGEDAVGKVCQGPDSGFFICD